MGACLGARRRSGCGQQVGGLIPHQVPREPGDGADRRLTGAEDRDHPHEGFAAWPHNQYSDDECDELESPVPPLVRQTHPVVEDVGAPFSGWAYADRETTLQYEDVKLVIPAGALLVDTKLTIRTISDREARLLRLKVRAQS